MGTKFSKMNFYISAMLFLAIALGLAMPTQTVRATPATTIVYDAIPSPLPPNMPSQPFQAGQASEFGDYIHLAGTDRILRTVTVTMSDWALYSDYSSDIRYSGDSVSWTHPITLNIYNFVAGTPNTVGSLLATVTQTSTIPWRPAGEPTCPDTGYGAGFAWKAGDGNCYNGYAFNITFDMSSLNVTLPNDIIVGVAYNTQSYGVAPIGVTGPYDSLNVGALGSATIGTDDNTDRVFFNSLTPSQYGDGGAGGVGIFREDINWTPYGTVPIQITTAPDCTGTSDCYVDVTTGNDANGGASFADAKKTIQAGVDAVAATGTVHVAAGTYVESAHPWTDIMIDKSISLIGAGSGATIVQLHEYNNPVGTHMDGVSIAASDVLIQGFTFTKASVAPYATGFNIRAGINVGTPPPANTFSNITLRDVESSYSQGMNVVFQGGYIFNNVTIEDSNFHHGGERNFYEAPGTTINGLTVKNSHFDYAGQQPGGDPIGFNLQGITKDLWIDGGTFNENPNGGIGFRSVTNGTIQYLTVYHSGYEASGNRAGIGIWEDVDTSSNILIKQVTVTNSGGRGIMVGTWAKTVTDVEIRQATITGSGNLGIMLYSGGAGGSLSNISVTGGTSVSSNNSHNYLADADPGTSIINPTVQNSIFSTTNGSNIYFYIPAGGTLTGAAVTNNYISGAPGLNSGVRVYGGSGNEIAIHNNSITGNGYGVNFTPGTGIVNAENNWWGSASGPGTVGLGSGDHVSANVDFTPWLCDGTDTDPAIGFQPNLTNLCPTIKVHIAKYLDGTQADATSADGYQFPMFASWSAANIGSGSGNYVLGNGHGGAPFLYQADTSPMTVGADYTTSEVTSGGSKVRLTCGEGAVYQLVGYKTSSISFSDAFENGAPTAAAPTFTGLTADQYIVVLNEKCPTLTVVKVLVPNTDTGKFNLTIDSTTYATNVGDSGTTGAVALNVGTHTVGETAGTGTSLANYLTTIDGDCASDGTITLALGENKTCTITNTKVNPNPAIALDKQEPVIATGGGPLTYNYLVSNPGNVPLSNVAVSDNKCSPVNYGSGDNSNNLLDPGETWTFTCTYTPSFISLKLTNKATVTGKFGPATYTATDSATLYPFTLKKKIYLYWDERSSRRVVYSPPDNTPFTVEIYKNNALISTITISQNAPGKLWLSNGTYTFKEVSVPPGYLAAVSSFTYTTMDGHGSHNSCHDNDRNNEHDDCDDGRNLNEWTYPNVIRYNLAIEKTGPGATARKGTTITYTYTVTNSGPASVKPKVIDDKCSYVTYVSGDTDHDGRVDPGETWNFKCNYKVTASIGSKITNKATVSDADQPKSWEVGGDINTSNNKDTWTLTVIK